MVEFKAFPKIPRVSKGVVITEKIDGTNACIVVVDPMEKDPHGEATELQVFAQSRNSVITPEKDNYGFARWVQTNVEELKKLGPGYHYGEWWGNGIQRNYGLSQKRFSLFNVGRWADQHGTNEQWGYREGQQFVPECCYVVPILSKKRIDLALQEAEDLLRAKGSVAAPGWGKPEGFILWMNDTYSKFLLENNDIPKSLVAAA